MTKAADRKCHIWCMVQKLKPSLSVSHSLIHRVRQTNIRQYPAQQASLIASMSNSPFSQAKVDRWGGKETMITEVFLLKVSSKSIREKQRSQEIAFSPPIANINLLWKIKKKDVLVPHIFPYYHFNFPHAKLNNKRLTLASSRGELLETIPFFFWWLQIPRNNKIYVRQLNKIVIL